MANEETRQTFSEVAQENGKIAHEIYDVLSELVVSVNGRSAEAKISASNGALSVGYELMEETKDVLCDIRELVQKLRTELDF